MGEENSQIVLIFLVSGGIVLLLAVLLILFLVIYQKRIVSQENRLQKMENERQRVLLKATIEGQERERQRLAKDLHDGIGSLLSGLSLNLKFQKNKEEPGSEQLEFLEQAVALVDEGITNVRAVSHDLMPATLDNFGLMAAINECIDPVNKSAKLKVDVKTINEPYELPKDVALGLLRIFQELLQNTIKHANASEVRTAVEFDDENLILKYADNGKGIDIAAKSVDGIGMKNMQSRVQALEGTFTLGRAGQKGFSVEIVVPREHEIQK